MSHMHDFGHVNTEEVNGSILETPRKPAGKKLKKVQMQLLTLGCNLTYSVQ